MMQHFVDPSPYNTWNDWNANQRDLFILDENGIFSQQNITSGLPSDLSLLSSVS